MNNQELEKVVEDKYDREWIEASYETIGWNKAPPLSDEDLFEIDTACGVHEYNTKKPNPPWFYETQIVKAVISKLKELGYCIPAEQINKIKALEDLFGNGVSCSDGSTHYLDENYKRYLISKILGLSPIKKMEGLDADNRS